ncbi:signal transduction histidine kinase/CHASE3 domain sensor protein/DNA-binding transcriptional MerR regulator [Symbiobacterium terraclitae]|uniref:histidine kinase n=1 Tax=Symbiobacterium terraclitae TaxID=557451 RepID=A0ABS4JQD2_9FIRM|nr:ATP-binding protein [Symbiobacterium terraclitae]MBP2017757.1 signal transduction histidine kinase/CHASE3 domain sensor protein/DNA-binding transcriptional MerR regulator [Symbiobacterium terraclitae]
MNQTPYRWDTGLRVRVFGLLLFLLSLLVGLGLILTITFTQLNTYRERAEASQQNVNRMQQVATTYAEMTAALRGYLLTGSEVVLAPYGPGLMEVEKLLTQLEHDVEDQDEQLARVRRVRELIENWRSRVADPEIERKRQGSPDAGSLLMDEGVNYIALIRAERDAFIDAESRLEETGMLNANRAADQVVLVTWLAISLAAVLALGGFLIFARGVTRSTTALAEAANRIAQGERGVVLEAPLDGELQVVANAFAAMSVTLAEQEKRLQAQQEQLIAQNEELLAQQESVKQHAEELERQERHLSRLHSLSSKMVGSIEIDQLSTLILDEYLDLYGGVAGALLMADEFGERLRVLSERWLSPELKGQFIPASGQLARCMELKEVVIARYPETQTRFSVWTHAVPVTQEIYVPLVHTGRAIGVVVIAFTEPTEVNAEARALWHAVASQASVALAAAQNHLEVKRAFTALQEQAAQIEMLNAQLEEERDRTSAQLDIYLSIVSTMPAGAWLCDTGGNLLVSNSMFQEFFGATAPDEPLEKVLARISAVLPPDDPFPEIVRQLIHDPRETADGRLHLTTGYTLQWSSAPVGSGQSRVGRLFTFQDVTELAELDRLKSEFVNTVSHELRTPLTSIMGYLSLVLAETVGPLQEQQREFLNVVSRNTSRLANLINDLLDIQRIESGRMPLNLTPTSLSQVVSQVAETFRVQAEQKGLSFTVNLPEGGEPLIQADPDRLTQIVSNLVSNAVKYTREGGVTITVSADGDRVELSVADTGIGISPSDQKRIFEKFYRAEHPYVREVGGTGLGLPIVRTMVEEHGGELRLESEPGKGSRFTVTFRAWRAE